MKLSQLSSDFETSLGRAAMSAGMLPDDRRTGTPSSLQEVLEQHSPRHAPRIAAQMRTVTDRLDGTAQGIGAPDRLMPLMVASSGACLALSVHRSGHVREAAVKRMGHIAGPFGLALLVLRLNDWVAEVRDAARDKVLLLNERKPANGGLSAQAIVGCIELLIDDDRFGRLTVDGRAVIAQLLNKPSVMPMVRSHIVATRRDDGPRWLGLGLRTGMFDDLLERCVREARHPSTRRIALKALLSSAYAWKGTAGPQQRDIRVTFDRGRLLAAALDDPAAELQRVALQHIIERPDCALNTPETFEMFLTHRSLSIMDRACFGLRRLGKDPNAALLDHVRRGTASAKAPVLLGWRGSEDDAETLFDLRDVVAPERRLPVLVAASRLRHQGARAELREIAFKGKDDAEAREANRALVEAGELHPQQALQAALVKFGPAFAERGFHWFVLYLPLMSMVTMTVRMAHSGIDERYLPWQQIERRRNTGRFAPSDQDLADLKDAVGDDREIARKIELLLGVGLSS